MTDDSSIDSDELKKAVNKGAKEIKKGFLSGLGKLKKNLEAIMFVTLLSRLAMITEPNQRSSSKLLAIRLVFYSILLQLKHYLPMPLMKKNIRMTMYFN